jgi:hypothetical protein
LNNAVLAPAGIMTEAGTVSDALLLDSATLEPPVGAVWERVTEQAATAPWPRLAGLQAAPEMSIPDTRLMAADFELLPRVAVTAAL